MGKLILESKENSFVVNGLEFQKGALTVSHSEDGIAINGNYASLSDVKADGSVLGNMAELKTWVSLNLFKSGGGDGGSGSQIPVGTVRQVVGYDSGGNPINVTLGWKQLSDLPTPPNFSNGLLAGTAFAQDGTALFAFVELALGDGGTSLVKPNAVPFYNPGQIGTGGGTLKVAKGIENDDAVNVDQLNKHNITWTNYTDVPLPTGNAIYAGGLIFYDGEQVSAPIDIGFDFDTKMSIAKEKSLAYYQNALPGYGNGGQLAVSDAVDDNHAISFRQLKALIARVETLEA